MSSSEVLVDPGAQSEWGASRFGGKGSHGPLLCEDSSDYSPYDKRKKNRNQKAHYHHIDAKASSTPSNYLGKGKPWKTQDLRRAVHKS